MITIVNVFESKIQNIHTLIFKIVMKFCIKSNHECSFHIYQNKLCDGNLSINIILIKIINRKKTHFLLCSQELFLMKQIRYIVNKENISKTSRLTI